MDGNANDNRDCWGKKSRILKIREDDNFQIVKVPPPKKIDLRSGPKMYYKIKRTSTQKLKNRGHPTWFKGDFPSTCHQGAVQLCN